jgi:5-methylcytosine-specific restriction enzyme subunit McrC
MQMPRLILTEFTPKRSVHLSVDERDALRHLAPSLQFEPTPRTEHAYDLTPDQHIGLVTCGDITLEIRPKVPMSSVLFLVSYACGLATGLTSPADYADSEDIVEILAVMLGRLVERVTRRGLLHGYQSEEEALQAPRGRMLFDEQLRRRMGVTPPVEVRHDVFTADILENRLLLSALNAMTRFPLRSEVAKRELVRAQRLFGAVRLVRFAPSAVPDVTPTRLNHHYAPAISLATLLLRSAGLELGAGPRKGSAFLIDMNHVFERFVRRALRDALDVGVSRFPDRPPTAFLDIDGVVPLKPDLCRVENGTVTWVGDAKYKRLPIAGYKNGDLYQALAYAIALNLPGATLIYAADEGVDAAQHVVVQSGKRLRVVALDLTAPPAAILSRVAELARAIPPGPVAAAC